MASCFFVCKKFFSTAPSLHMVFNHVTVIGGGLMGSGIAQITAQSGMDVTVIEVSEEAIKKSNANIKNSMQRVAKKLFQSSSVDAEKYISQTMGRLKISLDLSQAVSDTDLVIEAIVESLPAKHRLFTQIDAIAPERTIFASNTSSIPISEIAAVTNRKDRFGGLHFFNPVPVMKLLEVVRTAETSEDTFQKMMSWGKAIGKTCIACKDTPGFVVNRLLVPYLAEAARMLERGEASAKDIDIAMKLGAGYPMGPLELLDYVGLDTTKFILEGWRAKDPTNPLYAPITLINKLVSEGKLGKKTGEGFYSYKKSSGSHASCFLHCPYFLFPTSVTEKSSNEGSNELPKLDPTTKGTTRHEKTVTSSPREELKKTDDVHKFDKLEKLYKMKPLTRWKNSEEFLFAREKHNLDITKASVKKITSHLENYVSQETLNDSKIFLNSDDFIQFRREKIPAGIPKIPN